MIQTKIQSLATLDASNHGLSKSQRRSTSMGTDKRQYLAMPDNKEAKESVFAALPVSECTIELLQTPIEQIKASSSNLLLRETKAPTKSSLQESQHVLPTFSISGKPQKEPMSSSHIIAGKKVRTKAKRAACQSISCIPRIRCISVPSLLVPSL